MVMAIIMILMLLVIPSVTDKIAALRKKGCDALIDVIDAEIQLFEMNEGRLPGSVNELIQKGYLKESQRVCPDGRGINIIAGQAVCE